MERGIVDLDPGTEQVCVFPREYDTTVCLDAEMRGTGARTSTWQEELGKTAAPILSTLFKLTLSISL